MTSKRDVDVAIIGGGLVGSLCASMLAKRGYNVRVYEYREDIRTKESVRGRSINLALSIRGRIALREIGLEKQVIQQHGIAMTGRMIHNADGTKYSIPYDELNNECIYSVSRKYLNELLLTAAEKYENVKTSFCSKLISADMEDGVLTFFGMKMKRIFKEKADLIIGADGAYSVVRREMMKRPMYNYSQEYIEHGYLELCIPRTPEGEFAMEPNYLHIWPRGSFMMIALPNQDKSWTVTLFMPFEKFNEIDDSSKLFRFFDTHFSDSVDLISRKRLERDFFAVKPSPLISIKCKPYHFEDKVLIIGDAAHAMVPFYGQGMNAGFEDCTILNQLMIRYSDRLDLVLSEFSKTRYNDAEAICDLAMYNYVEMRDLVNRKTFLLRKKLDNALYRLFPKVWVPLYNSVTFTDIRYSQCVENRKYQDKILLVAAIVIVAEMLLSLYSVWSQLSE